MSRSNRNYRMGDLHEAHLAAVLGGRRTRGSGNQWRDTMDGKHDPYEEFSFAWDGKSTLGKSIGVTREMWSKAEEQADGHRPMLALRWYADESLRRVDLDLAVVVLDDIAEMRGEVDALRIEVARLRARLGDAA